MTGVFSIIGAALLASVAAVLIKGFGFKGAEIFSATAVCALLAYALSSSLPIFDFLSDMPEDISEYAGSCIKAVGIGYATGITADVCRELGEGGIAKAVSVAAKIEIALVALPHIREITDLAIELMKG